MKTYTSDRGGWRCPSVSANYLKHYTRWLRALIVFGTRPDEELCWDARPKALLVRRLRP